ncbi:MAG: class F sortase [bacterium]|nr:class F sortase [bacterium]
MHELLARYTTPQVLSKQILFMIVFLGVTISIVLLLYFIPKSSIQDGSALLTKNTATLSNQEQASIGLPLRLKIPSIDVDAPVEYVGLTYNGAMDVPKSPIEVGWFNLGPRPGENGSAVIAGHYGWKNNLPAVFDNLHTLRVGDEIFVEDENGFTTTFIVRKIKIYGKDEITPEVFSSSDGKAHLNLITCTGDWNTEEKTRSQRLVVFTDKE